MSYVVVSGRPWNRGLAERLTQRVPGAWTLIQRKEDFTPEYLKVLSPTKIFVPNWSHFIPKSIFANYEVVLFHMTDLPFGRGGSPLQNLIVRGISSTQISALRVVEEVDAGPIYLKRPLSLDGAAHEIFKRADAIIEEMIVEIIKADLRPIPQHGEVVTFERRKPEQSSLTGISDSRQVFDYIRMLDADGYPHAYLETASFRVEFRGASIDSEGVVTANARIIKK